MSAAESLAAVVAVGVTVVLDGHDLVLAAKATPPANVVERLLHDKARVIQLLQQHRHGWSTVEWLAYFTSCRRRAECEGRFSSDQATVLAQDCCVAEWLCRTPQTSSSERCLACGHARSPHDQLTPYGTDAAGCVWLHSRCWRGWFAGRKVEAMAGLAAIGISVPTKLPDDFVKNGGA